MLMKTAGAPEAVIALCKFSESPRVLTNCAAALANLALDNDMSQMILSKGGADILSRLMMREQDHNVLRFASGAVRNLSRAEQNKAIVLDLLLKQLLHLCGICGADCIISTNTTGALANLAVLEDNRIVMVRADVPRAIVSLCRRLVSSESLDSATISQPLEFGARCLATLSYSASNCTAIVESGVPQLLRDLCAHESMSPVVLGNASVVLMHLALEPACRTAMLQTGGVEALVELLSRQQLDEKILANAARALANLGLEPELRAPLVDHGAARPLVHLCCNSRAAVVLANSAWALANLAHDTQSSKQLIQDGVQRALLATKRAFGSKLPQNLDRPLAVAIARLDSFVRQESNMLENAQTDACDAGVRELPRPRWMANDEAMECMQCGAPFGFFRGRHHCRRCGGIFCDACSQARVLLPFSDIVRNPEATGSGDESSNPQRVCRDCEAKLVFAAELKEEDTELQNNVASAKEKEKVEVAGANEQQRVDERSAKGENKERGKQKQEEHVSNDGLESKDDDESLKSAALALLD
eukprot:g150.t1